MTNIKLHRWLKRLVFILITASILSCSIVKLEPELAPQIPKKIQTAENFLAKGVGYYSQYDYKQADIFFNKALYAYRIIDNPQGIILSVVNMAKTALALGNIQLAQNYVVKAKALIRGEEAFQNNIIIYHLIIVESSINIEKQQYLMAKKILQPLLEKNYIEDNSIMIAALQNRVRIAIAEQDKEVENWLQRFAQMISSSPTSSRNARLMRFRATLSQDTTEQNKYYNEAIKLYRSAAHQVGIAATLEEWSQQQYHLKQYLHAADKLERALFIRIDLLDRRNCISILKKLHKIYQLLNNKEKAEQTFNWLKKLSSIDFSRWYELTENYP